MKHSSPSGEEKRREKEEKKECSQTPQSLLYFHTNSTTVCQHSQHSIHSTSPDRHYNGVRSTFLSTPENYKVLVRVAQEQHKKLKIQQNKADKSWCVGVPFLELLMAHKSFPVRIIL